MTPLHFAQSFNALDGQKSLFSSGFASVFRFALCLRCFGLTARRFDKCAPATSADGSDGSPDSIWAQAANSVGAAEATAGSLPGRTKTNQRKEGERRGELQNQHMSIIPVITRGQKDRVDGLAPMKAEPGGQHVAPTPGGHLDIAERSCL